MATQVPHLFIKEHMEKLGISDDEMAKRLGLSSRSSIWKQYKEQDRLDLGKMQQIADAMGLPLAQLFYPPGVESLDAIAANADLDERKRIADVLRRLLQD